MLLRGLSGGFWKQVSSNELMERCMLYNKLTFVHMYIHTFSCTGAF